MVSPNIMLSDRRPLGYLFERGGGVRWLSSNRVLLDLNHRLLEVKWYVKYQIKTKVNMRGSRNFRQGSSRSI